MGYTHYWRRRKEIPQETFNVLVEDFKKLLSAVKEEGVVIRNYDGNGVPEANEVEIWFNGYGDDSHESFGLPRVEEERHVALGEEGWYFAFCKTARKPYDVLVASFLLACKKRIGDDFRVSSDGGDAEWQYPKELCQKVLGFGERFYYHEDDGLVEREEQPGISPKRKAVIVDIIVKGLRDNSETLESLNLDPVFFPGAEETDSSDSIQAILGGHAGRYIDAAKLLRYFADMLEA